METVEVNSVVIMLAELSEDTNVPKNVRAKVKEVITVLESPSDNGVKVHEALNIIEEISNDTNLESYTRSQVYGVASMLERMN